MVSLGFKGVGGYFILANASKGHVGYMRAAHAADLAHAPFIPPFDCLKFKYKFEH